MGQRHRSFAKRVYGVYDCGGWIRTNDLRVMSRNPIFEGKTKHKLSVGLASG